MAAKTMKVAEVWAIIRIDSPHLSEESEDDLANRISVKEVVMDEELAAAEVHRLNELNREKGAYYFYHVTRLKDHERNVLP